MCNFKLYFFGVQHHIGVLQVIGQMPVLVFRNQLVIHWDAEARKNFGRGALYCLELCRPFLPKKIVA